VPSKYQELFELSENARKELIGHQNRCRQYMATIVGEMLKYGEIPLNTVTYLRWDAEEKIFREPDTPGHHYSIVGGMGFDGTGDCRLGVSFALPAHHVTFGLFVSEVNGKVSVQLGSNKPISIDVNDSVCLGSA
jgi:hypothetical protein